MAASGWRRVAAVCVLGLGWLAAAGQDRPAAPKYPTAAEVADVLQREPITPETWPAWRARLLDWINDRGQGTDPAFEAARKFVRSQANDKDELNAALAKDSLAWYLLAGAYYADEPDTKTKADSSAVARRAEKAVRKSIELDPKLAQAHRNLALYLLKQEENAPGEQEDAAKLTPRLQEAVQQLDEAARLNPQAPIGHIRGMVGMEAYNQSRYGPAETQLLLALKEDPDADATLVTRTALAMLRSTRLKDYPETVAALEQFAKEHPKQPGPRFVLGLTFVEAGNPLLAYEAFSRGMDLGGDPAKLIPSVEAHLTARKVMNNKQRTWQQGARDLQVLAAHFPRDGEMAVLHALARHEAGEYELAASELTRARQQGTSPEIVLDRLARGNGVRLAEEIQFHAVRYRWYTAFLWVALAVGLLYVVGLPLLFLVTSIARKSATADAAKPDRAPPALGPAYGLALLAGIGFFYVTLLFLFVGLVVLAGGLFFLLVTAPQMSLGLMALLALVIVLGWFFLSMVFAGPPREKLGIAVAGTIPRLREAVDEVVRQLDSERVDELRVAAGAGVNLYIVGRGPAGVLGGHRRVLVLGYTSLRLLTVPEFQALVAQQLAPLSKRDDERARLIYRRWLAMTDALADMRGYGSENNGQRPFGRSRGSVRPLYFVLSFYQYLFSLQIGPYIRARLLAADQTAGKLHGAMVLESALLKVNADAPLYKSRLDALVKELVVEAPDLSNMYAAWDELCGDTPPEAQNDALLPARAVRELHYALLAVSTRERNQARRQALARAAGATDDALIPGEVVDFSPRSIRPVMRLLSARWLDRHNVLALAERIDALRPKAKADKPKKDAATEIMAGSPGAPRKDEPTRSVVAELLDDAEGLEEQLTEFSISPPPAAGAARVAPEPSGAK